MDNKNNDRGKIVLFNNPESNKKIAKFIIYKNDQKVIYKFDNYEKVNNILNKQFKNYFSKSKIEEQNKVFFELKDKELEFFLLLIKKEKLRYIKINKNKKRKNKLVTAETKVLGTIALISALSIAKLTIGIEAETQNNNNNIIIESTEQKTSDFANDIVETAENFSNDLIDKYKNLINYINDTLDKYAKEKKEEEIKKKKEEIKEKQKNCTKREFDISNIDIDEDLYNRYTNTFNNYYRYFDEIGSIYGIDPNLITLIATQERGKHHEKVDSNGAIGICQIQKNHYELDILKINNFKPEKYKNYINNYSIKCYNFDEKKYEEIIAMTDYTKKTFEYYNLDLSNYKVINLSNLEDNILACAATLQNGLKEFNGDLPTTIIAYNQGTGATKKYIKYLANNYNISTKAAQKKPKEWIQYIPKNYGDKSYIYNVLRFAIAANTNKINCRYIDESDKIKEATLNIKGININKEENNNKTK